MSERIAMKRQVDLVEGQGLTIDYMVQLRSDRSGYATRVRFDVSGTEILIQSKVAKAMAHAVAKALKAGYDAGLVAARCAPDIPLSPQLESMVRNVIEAPPDWRDGYMERKSAEDAREGVVEFPNG